MIQHPCLTRVAEKRYSVLGVQLVWEDQQVYSSTQGKATYQHITSASSTAPCLLTASSIRQPLTVALENVGNSETARTVACARKLCERYAMTISSRLDNSVQISRACHRACRPVPKISIFFALRTSGESRKAKTEAALPQGRSEFVVCIYHVQAEPTLFGQQSDCVH